MALTVEDGTGLAAADAYESAAATAARALALDLPEFNNHDETHQERIIRRQTKAADRRLRDFVDGVPRTEGQARLFPRSACFRRQGAALASDEVPEEIKDALAYRCEDDAAGRLSCPTVNSVELKSDGSRTTTLSPRPVKFHEQSPQAHAELLNLMWVGS